METEEEIGIEKHINRMVEPIERQKRKALQLKMSVFYEKLKAEMEAGDAPKRYEIHEKTKDHEAYHEIHEYYVHLDGGIVVHRGSPNHPALLLLPSGNLKRVQWNKDINPEPTERGRILDEEFSAAVLLCLDQYESRKAANDQYKAKKDPHHSQD